MSKHVIFGVKSCSPLQGSFGYHLIVHCRNEALNTLSAGASPETKAVVEEAIDTALHNVMDMLEGFGQLDDLLRQIS